MTAKRTETATEIGDPKWRPSAVHPLAALFPVLEADDLKSLSEHIKENGLQVPVVIDKDGMLIDGRMRLRPSRHAPTEFDRRSLRPNTKGACHRKSL